MLNNIFRDRRSVSVRNWDLGTRERMSGFCGSCDNEAGNVAGAVLAEHRALRQRSQGLGPRSMTPGLRVMLWALRTYVLLMVTAVVLNVIAAR